MIHDPSDDSPVLGGGLGDHESHIWRQLRRRLTGLGIICTSAVQEAAKSAVAKSARFPIASLYTVESDGVELCARVLYSFDAGPERLGAGVDKRK